MMRFRRDILAAALLLASPAPSRAALPEPEAPPAAATLTGRLLVATPELTEPLFRHTVILLVRHGEDGALGITVNRPLGERPWAELMAGIGQDGSGLAGSVRVFAGGPVRPASGFVLHSAEYRRDATLAIDDRVSMTSTVAILRDIAGHAGPRQSLIAFGYAGWAPGQLENEVAARAWFTIPDDARLIFDDDRAKLWDEAVARRTIAL
jgi:putative transcriptional regulator